MGFSGLFLYRLFIDLGYPALFEQCIGTLCYLVYIVLMGGVQLLQKFIIKGDHLAILFVDGNGHINMGCADATLDVVIVIKSKLYVRVLTGCGESFCARRWCSLEHPQVEVGKDAVHDVVKRELIFWDLAWYP